MKNLTIIFMAFLMLFVIAGLTMSLGFAGLAFGVLLSAVVSKLMG